LRASRVIGVYVAGVILLGALLAPWLFWITQQLAPHVSALQGFAAYPFHRFFDRSVMIVALAGVWPLLRILGFHSWSGLGYIRARGSFRHLLGGWVLGAGSLALLIMVTVAWGSHTVHLDKSGGQIAGAMLRYFFVGVAVALVEETLFRGVLQGALQRQMNAVLALLAASVVYSAVHFLKPYNANIPADQVQWNSGFICLIEAVPQSFNHHGVFVSIVTLFLAGCVLGLAYVKTGALYLPIGLHAGWVWSNEFARWLGAGSISDDMVAWPMLVLLLLVIARLCQNKLRPLPDLEPSRAGHDERLR
jgi:uncharacterized protein